PQTAPAAPISDAAPAAPAAPISDAAPAAPAPETPAASPEAAGAAAEQDYEVDLIDEEELDLLPDEELEPVDLADEMVTAVTYDEAAEGQEDGLFEAVGTDLSTLDEEKSKA
ncbi:MAG: hypothetical protein ACR2P8_06960, partial [Myxococcota bacterium]